MIKNKMKGILIIILLVFITTKKNKPKDFDYDKQYSAFLKRIFVNKAYQVKTKKDDYMEKINVLHIPDYIKNRVKNQNDTKIISGSNIDISFTESKGGKAKGELYYFRKDEKGVSFKYGSADAVLFPLKPFKIQKCSYVVGLIKKCRDVKIKPHHSEEKLKSFLNLKMREAIQKELYKKYNKTKTK